MAVGRLLSVSKKKKECEGNQSVPSWELQRGAPDNLLFKFIENTYLQKFLWLHVDHLNLNWALKETRKVTRNVIFAIANEAFASEHG